MGILSVLLLAASVAGFDYFVSREDGEGVCVSNERKWGGTWFSWGKDLVPFYDLENGVFPDEREEKWVDAWQLRQLKIHTFSSSNIRLNHRIVTTDGADQFKSIVKGNFYSNFLVLASEATLLWSENENWREGSSFRVHLNQLVNPAEDRRHTWAEFCTDLSTKPEKCQRLSATEDNTGGADVLFEGRRWTFLGLKWVEGLTLFTEDYQTLVKWSTKSIEDFWPHFLFARTESTRGVFFVSLQTGVRPMWNGASLSENEMSRTFSVGPKGKLCIIDVKWLGANGDLGRFELLNSSNKVEHQGRLVADEKGITRLNFTLGRGGDFKLRLLDVKKTIGRIGACAAFKIWSPSNGCYVYENGFDDRPAAKLFSAQLNASLQVDLTKKQMMKVCKALKVKPGDKALRFNTKWGAAFKKCPNKP